MNSSSHFQWLSSHTRTSFCSAHMRSLCYSYKKSSEMWFIECMKIQQKCLLLPCFQSQPWIPLLISDWHIAIPWRVVSLRAEQESSFFHSVSSNSTVSGAVDAWVCAVMWSSHASVLRKYVSFHLWDAERCKAAACLPGSSREEERLCPPSYKPATWRGCYSGPLPCVDGRFWGLKGSEWALIYDPGQTRWDPLDLPWENVIIL